MLGKKITIYRVVSFLLAVTLLLGNGLAVFASDANDTTNYGASGVVNGLSGSTPAPYGLGTKFNVALLGNPRIHKGGNSDRPAGMLNDGIINTLSNYAEFGSNMPQNADDPYYVEIDLLYDFEIESINLWRYWADSRTYKNTVILVSDDDTFASPTVVYNADSTDFFGYGVGADIEYSESASGKEIVLSTPAQGRYVRVLNNGHSSGQGAHYVEMQIWSTLDQLPDPGDILPHADIPLDIPTYSASGKQEGETHPDVVVFDNPWNGFTHWMAVTPNQNGNSQFENPSLVASNDGIDWEVPAGITNPLTGVSEEPRPYHNCDVDLVYNASEDSLYLYYIRTKNTPGFGETDFEPSELRLIKIKEQAGSFVVFPPETVLSTTYRYDILSPSIVRKAADEWLMWSINAGDVGFDNQSNFIELRTSSDGLMWREPISLAHTFSQPGFLPWHIDVTYTDAGEYIAAFPAYPDGGDASYTELFLATSADSMTWTHFDEPVLKPVKGRWDNAFIYRASLLLDGDNLRVWYSGGVRDGWKIGYTEQDYSQLLADLGPGTTPEGWNWDRVYSLGKEIMFDENWSKLPSEKIAITAVEDAKATLHFYGTGIRWMGNKDINYGSAKIYIDDNLLPMTVSARGAAEKDQILFEDDSLSEDFHTFTVEAVGDGEIDITAMQIDYNRNATIATRDLIMDTAPRTAYAYDVFDIVGYVSPYNANQRTVKFTSSDDTILSVTPEGNAVAKGDIGTATVTAIIEGTSFTKSVEYNIREMLQGTPRREISAESPLYLENFYWGETLYGTRNIDDSPVKLWSTIPDELKPYTVILLIAEQSLENKESVTSWLAEYSKICNDNQIPFAIQNLNGETRTSRTIPISFYEDLALKYEYLHGFGAAELYNSPGWFGDDGDHTEYVSELIRMGVKNGVYMMWTDTNVFGTKGVLMDWIEESDNLRNALRNNKEYIAMMYKESYGSPMTDSLYLGMWLTEYCGNWGVASDWWHWQLDGNGGMFNDSSDGNAYKECLMYPEVMFVQDMFRVMSQGATCYKSEAQFYSNASMGRRNPAYQYAIIPYLLKIVRGEFKIPTQEEVLAENKVVVVGQHAGTGWFNNINYNTYYSQLYPKTARYGLIPFVPEGTPQEQLDKFSHVFTQLPTKAELDVIYPEEKAEGTAWCENFDNAWYWMNSSEDKDVYQYSTFVPNYNSSTSVTIGANPHTMAYVAEDSGSMSIYLSNYRLDKQEIFTDSKWNPFDGNTWYKYIWEMQDRMESGTGKDTDLRTTIIKIENPVEPEIIFAETDEYTRPYHYSTSWNEATSTLSVEVEHNGQLEMFVTTQMDLESISLAPDSKTISPGDIVQLAATITPKFALRGKEIVWTSSDETVATVLADGLVIGRRGGTAAITATIDGISAAANITVKDSFEEKIVPIVLVPTTGGNITSLPDKTVVYGEDVMLQFIPNRGYHLKAAYANGVKLAVDGSGKVTMPSVKDILVVTAEFEQEKDPTEENSVPIILVPTTGGNITSLPDKTVVYGEDVMLQFIPNRGYHLKAAYANGVKLAVDGSGKVTMPSVKDILVVTAEFEQENEGNSGKTSTSGSSGSSGGQGQARIDGVTYPALINKIISMSQAGIVRSVTEQLLKTPENQENSVVVKLKNVDTLSAETISTLQSKRKSIQLYLNSIDVDKNQVITRLMISLDSLTQPANFKQNLSKSEQVSTLFKKFFRNSLYVLSFEEETFEKPITIVQKLSFENLSENIVFYAYTPETNQYHLLDLQNVFVDANNYVHFTTSIGGTIIISDGLLGK